MEGTIEKQNVAVELVSRVQLRAVFSGLMVGAGVYAVCMGLSWAIGLGTFQPTADQAKGLAIGNSIWGAVALWLSLFVGAFIAALVGRSLDGRTGVLHGLVVWGATAAVLGVLIVMMFGSVLGSIVQIGVQPLAPSPRNVGAVVRVTDLAVWFYWTGIAGGLFTSILGGLVGARTETRPRRVVVRQPVGGGVPQPV
jgi:hypothetical protein